MEKDLVTEIMQALGCDRFGTKTVGYANIRYQACNIATQLGIAGFIDNKIVVESINRIPPEDFNESQNVARFMNEFTR